MRIGFGLASGADPELGIQQVARIIALPSLVSVLQDGRLSARLAESWSVSPDGLIVRIRLRPSVTFHSGKPADAQAIKDILDRELADDVGSASDDLVEIRAVSDRDLDVVLRRPSTFLLERLADVPIEESGSPLSGTGPFKVVSAAGTIEMRANETYFGGKPLTSAVVIEPYTSVRSAWADMLRGRVDVLYDVGVDALDSMEASNEVTVFTFQRGYVFMLLLNTRRPYLSDPEVRRRLNAAIDRTALVTDVFQGHATAADGPVWPHHWAYDSNLPRFHYQPQAVPNVESPRKLTCLVFDRSHERLALAVQRQLQASGLDIQLSLVAGDQALSRLGTGDFDMVLADYFQGPNLARPYVFWHSGGQYNWGHYSNKRVDEALDGIRAAGNDEAYKTSVGAFQRAIIDDPPAVFLVWRERARAVSRRFSVPVQPNTDMLLALHLWRPAGPPPASSN